MKFIIKKETCVIINCLMCKIIEVCVNETDSIDRQLLKLLFSKLLLHKCLFERKCKEM